MKSIDIKGTKRESTGKKASKELRNNELVPCILYGGKQVIHFQVHEIDLKHLIYTPNVYIVKLSVGNKKHQAVLREVQFNPVTDKIQHIDFLEIFDDKNVTVQIPVIIKGDSIGIKQGGKLHLKKRKIATKGLPANLPDNFDIDITELAIGKSIRIGDLSFPDVELIDPKNDVVCSVKVTRIAKGSEEGAVEGAIVEGAIVEGAAAEGAAATTSPEGKQEGKTPTKSKAKE